MVVVKWSDTVEGYEENIDESLCSGLYKEDGYYLVPWSGTYPYANTN